MSLPREDALRLITQELMPYADTAIIGVVADLMVHHQLVMRLNETRFVAHDTEGNLKGLAHVDWLNHNHFPALRAALIKRVSEHGSLLRYGAYHEHAAYIANYERVWRIGEDGAKVVLNGCDGLFFKQDATFIDQGQQVAGSAFDNCSFDSAPQPFSKRGRKMMTPVVQRAMFKAWLMCAMFQCPSLPHLVISVTNSLEGSDLFHLGSMLLQTPCLQTTNGHDVRKVGTMAAAAVRIGRRGITFPKLDLPMFCIAQTNVQLRAYAPVLAIGGSARGKLSLEDAQCLTSCGRRELITDLAYNLQKRCPSRLPLWFYIFSRQIEHEAGYTTGRARDLLRNWWEWSHKLVYRKDLVVTKLPEIKQYERFEH